MGISMGRCGSMRRTIVDDAPSTHHDGAELLYSVDGGGLNSTERRN